METSNDDGNIGNQDGHDNVTYDILSEHPGTETHGNTHTLFFHMVASWKIQSVHHQ